MSEAGSKVTITRNEGASRYEAYAADELAGYAEFQLTDGGIACTPTVVDDAFEGQGVGSRLAATALDEARDAGLRVAPRCSFIKAYIERHPEYLDLMSS